MYVFYYLILLVDCIYFKLIFIALLLTFCQNIPELNKSITSGMLNKILESITKINSENRNHALSNLTCFETCLGVYPGSCAPFKPTIDTFLLSFIDSSNPNIVNQVGKCLHIFQQVFFFAHHWNLENYKRYVFGYIR